MELLLAKDCLTKTLMYEVENVNFVVCSSIVVQHAIQG